MVKRALLVGCNYPDSKRPLSGCVNDVLQWKPILEEIYGFEEGNIEIMIDTDDAYVLPTGKNVKNSLKRLVAASQDGDVLFFHFSGHGVQIPDDDESEEQDKKDEAICPTDFNLIIDDDMREIVGPLNPGCKFTFTADSCHSGGLLDHEVVAIGGPDEGTETAAAAVARGIDSTEFKVTPRFIATSTLIAMLKAYLAQEAAILASQLAKKAMEVGQAVAAKAVEAAKDAATNAVRKLLYKAFGEDASNAAAKYKTASRDLPSQYISAGVKPPPEKRNDPNKGILITGCQAQEESGDVTQGDNFYGAFTHSLQNAIKAHHKEHPGKSVSNRDLVQKVRADMRPLFDQNPGLECSEKNADSPFLMH